MGGPDAAPGSRTVTVRGKQYRLTAAEQAAWARQMAARARKGGMGASAVRTGVVNPRGPLPTLTPTQTATAAPGAPAAGKAATPDPYAGLDPAVASALRQIDWEQQSHLRYLGFGADGKQILNPDGTQAGVAGWLAGATKALAGISDAAGQNYRNQISTAVGGAYNAAAGADTPVVDGRGSGGTYSPSSYLTPGQQNLAATRGAAATDMASWQAMLDTRLNVVRQQAQVQAMADYAAGLPAAYATRRMETKMEMEKYLADLEVRKAQAAETARHNTVTEAQGAQNAITNAAIAFGKLGISADKLALDEKGQVVQMYDQSQIPPGYTQLPNGKIVTDRSQSGSAAKQPPLSRTQDGLLQAGWTRIGAGRDPKKIDRSKFKVVQAADTGAWMVIRRTGAGTGTAAKPPEVKPVAKLGADLRKLYKGPADPLTDPTPGIEDRYPGNPRGAAEEVVDWLYSNRKQFTRPDGFVDMSRLLQAIKIGVDNPDGQSSIVGFITSLLADPKNGKITGKAPNRKWR